MSDTSFVPSEPTPAMPTVTDPTPTVTDPTPTVTDPTPTEQEPALHPAWEKALEATPEYLRKPIIDQIRTSERESQAAIQAARGTIEPQWQDLITQARTAQITPSELQQAWNAAQAIREDPEKFATELNDSIDKLVAEGRYTRKQAAAAKQEVAAAAAGAEVGDPLLTPEAQQLIEVQRQLAEVQNTVLSQQQAQVAAQQQAQAEAQAKAWGDQFFTKVDAKFGTAARLAAAADPAAKQAVVDTQIALARYADSLLAADPTNTLTEEQAIEQAFTVLQRASAQVAAPAAAARPAPVGGGGSSVTAPTGARFKTEADREAAMMAEAARVAGLE